MNKIMKKIKIKADYGDPVACFKLSINFLFGDDKDRNIPEGMKYLNKAAENNVVDAQALIGVVYDEGELVDRNVEAALKWYELSAASGDLGSMTNLGYMYENGDGVQKNIAVAFEYTAKAAERGNEQAIYNLGLYYQRGVGCEPNIEKAIEWFEKGVQKKVPRCMHALGLLFSSGVHVEEDPEAAFSYFKSSAECGWLSSFETYALCLLNGYGTDINIDEGIKWSEKGAEQGDSASITNMGVRYIEGELVSKNRELGIELLKKASSKNLHAAENLLSIMTFEEIENVDLNEYVTYCSRLAEIGNQIGIAHLAYIHKIGKGVEKSLSEYERLLKKVNPNSNKYSFVLSAVNELEKINAIADKDFKNYYECFIKLLDKCTEIKSRHLISEPDGITHVAHFTNLEVLHKFLPIPKVIGDGIRPNHLRMYNIEYMNDPEEGLRLLNFGEKSKKINKFISINGPGSLNRDIEWASDIYSAYITSLTSNIDRLDMWRAYGKDGNGYCIVMPADLFDKSGVDAYLYFTGSDSEDAITKEAPLAIPVVSHRPTDTGKTSEFLTIDHFDKMYKDNKKKESRGTLYKILYSDTEVEQTLDTLNPVLEELLHLRSGLAEGCETALDRVVQVIISDILYLYKSNEYNTEKEVRLIKILPISSNLLGLDENQVPKLFVKTDSFLFDNNNFEIIIGPKVVEHKNVEIELKYRLMQHGMINKTRVRKSSVQYR